MAQIIRAHDHNQLFVAFTATPSNATVQLFGDAFDTYSEAEAIQEGYIVDVAASIISYEVCEEKIADPIIVGNIQSHRDDERYLRDHYKPQVRTSIESSYEDRALYERLVDPKYTDDGSIFDTMAYSVIQAGVEMRL
jgi:hypothetical protein